METPKAPRSRCKFRVESVKRTRSREQVEFVTEYDGQIPEDQKFSRATPIGEMKIDIENPELRGGYQPGQFVYIDITPAD